MQSHLIWHGFVKDYTIWKYHGEEADSSATGASDGGNSSTVNDGGRQPSAAEGGDSVNRDYISLHDLIGDDGSDDDEQGDVVLGPKDVEIFFKCC